MFNFLNKLKCLLFGCQHVVHYRLYAGNTYRSEKLFVRAKNELDAFREAKKKLNIYVCNIIEVRRVEENLYKNGKAS